MKLQPRDLPDHLLSIGRHDVTTAEAGELLELDAAPAAVALARLRQKGQLFSPARGLYIVVPPDYRSWGVVPGEWFVDAMMRHLERSYYVALLTAAAFHGASHQAPQVFQVMTDRYLANRALGRIRLRFHVNQHVDDDPVGQMSAATGYFNISTKETTVVDLVNHPKASGGFGNVASILKEIGCLDGSDLARIASRRGRTLTRRVGWLVEHFGQANDLEALRQAARVELGEPALLDPSSTRRGRADLTWSIRVNVDVEPDT